MIPTKEETIEIINKYVKEKANLEHNLMVGYGMLGLAKYFKLPEPEQNKWFVAGCLHDIDIEEYGGEMKNHCVVGEELLRKEDIDEDIIKTIKSHNDILNIPRTTKIENALYSCDGLTGIIRAYVLLRPDKDIQQAKVKSITKKLKDKTFAQGVSREKIRVCEQTLNTPLNEFIEAVLNGIKENMKFN